MTPLILLASSRRRGNTGALVDAIAGELGADIVDLAALNISAYDYDHGNRDDDFEPLMGRVLASNPLILASPIYWYSCASPMKMFLDRICDYLDIPELLESGRRLRGKHAYVACTSARDQPSEHFVGTFVDTCAYLGMDFRGLVHINCSNGYQAAEHGSIVRQFVDGMQP